MPKLMTKQQLVDENIALRHNAEQLEAQLRTAKAEADMFARNALNFEQRLNAAEEELRVERALHAVQSAKLAHYASYAKEHMHRAHYGAKTVLRTAYQEACLKARELAKRTGKVVRVGD